MTNTISRRTAMLLPLALPLAARTPEAHAQGAPVLIGATYPLSGSAASAGQEMKAAIEIGLDIINNAHPELKDLPLGPTPGLPNLQGRKVSVDFADHQGNPAVAQSQTLAADHPRPRRRHGGRISIELHAHLQRCGRTLRHSFRRGRVHRAQPDGTRL